MRCKIGVLLLALIFSGNQLLAQEVFDSSIVRFQKMIHFGSGKYELVDINRRKIDSLINKINLDDDLQLFIDAHTDDIGSEAFNLDLSKKRKESVYEYLVQKGIDETIITSQYHGEQNLAIKKTDPSSRRINRRVVINAFATERLLRIKGQIVDEVTHKGIPGIVTIESSNYKLTVTTNKEGYYEIAAPLDKIATIEYHAEDYFFDRKEMLFSEKVRIPKVPLRRATIGSKLILRNVNFEGNKNIFLPEALPHLDNLIKFMTINEDACIELAGHIHGYEYECLALDNSQMYDYDLSIARSLIVYEKLKEAGIDEKRMVAKGYGDDQLLYPEAKSTFEMKENRRVEMIIADCDSIKMIANDTLVQPKYYSNIVTNRRFNKENLDQELRYFYNKRRSEILLKVRELIDNGQEPSNYTYGELLVEGQKIKFKHNKGALILRDIYNADQKLRRLSKTVELKYGKNSKELMDHRQRIKEVDSINLIAVRKILDTKGWLGPEEVSEIGNEAIFLVIQHSDLNTQLSYLPMMRQAVREGNAAGHDLALLEDRVAVKQGKKQIYGSQINRDLDSGVYYVAPLENPENVNIRRKEVGLDPIENYILRWNLIWKKELKRMLSE